MKKLISLFIGLFLIGTASVQAQSATKFDDIVVVNSQANNVTVQIKVAEQYQAVSSRIAQSEVNRKADFAATLNADNTLLTLDFTRQFSENELNILLEYSGIKLEGKAFNELYNLINQ